MRFPLRRILLPLLLVAVLSACGGDIPLANDVSMPRPVRVLLPRRVAAPANPWAAGPKLAEIAVERDAAGARFAALVSQVVEVVPWSWDCVANAETGGDWSMTGSGYSSGLGVMNAAIRENATVDVAERILAGTASRAEQIEVGERIVERFGIDAWAASTVDKCT